MSATIEDTTTTTEATTEAAPLATVTVNTATFKDALARFAKVVPVNSFRAVLRGIMITVNYSRVTLYGTDLEIALRVDLNVNTEAEGATVADYKMLAAAVRGIKTEKTVLTIYDQKVIVEDTAGGMWSTCWAVGDIGDFPEMALRAVETDKNRQYFRDLSVPGAALAEAMRYTLNGVATTDTCHALAGVYMNSDRKGGIECASSNAHLLYTHRLPILSGDQLGDAGFILLPQAAEWLAKHAKDAGEIHIQTDPSMVCFRGEGWIFGTRQLEGMFPRYREAMPAPDALPGRLVVNRKELLAVLKMADAHCSPETRRVDLLPNENGNAVEVRAVCDGKIQFSMMVPAASRKCRPTRFNGLFLAKFLAAYGGETVTIRYAEPSRHEEPAAVYDADKGFVLMPIDNNGMAEAEKAEHERMIKAYQAALAEPDQEYPGAPVTNAAPAVSPAVAKRPPSFKAVVAHAKADPGYLSSLLAALGIQAAAV